MTPNNAFLEDDSYSEETTKKIIEDDMFIPLECF